MRTYGKTENALCMSCGLFPGIHLNELRITISTGENQNAHIHHLNTTLLRFSFYKNKQEVISR
jgi:hypothetical protein